MLDGSSRIGLVNDQAGGDLQQEAQSSFQQLFRDDALRARLSEIVRQALGSYVVIDPTNLGQLRLRLSKVQPPSPAVERGLEQASIEFHASATHIAEASDGAKAFVGILNQILAGNPEILLIDEPEGVPSSGPRVHPWEGSCPFPSGLSETNVRLNPQPAVSDGLHSVGRAD